MLSLFRFPVLRLIGLVAIATVAGCSTTGNQFDTTDLRFLVPGETTLQEATVLLQGEPVNVYRQANGAATARWAHTATLVTDAVYFSRELWLSFDAHGRFERIVKSNNLPHANLYEAGRRVDVPMPRVAASVWPAPAQVEPAPAPPPASDAGAFSRTTVTYPIGR